MFHCPYCPGYSGHTFKKLLHHIRFLHSKEPNFSITCGECGKFFTNFASFKSHIRRKHGHGNGDPATFLDMQNDDELPIQDETQSDDENELDNEGNSVGNLTRFLALFILKTKEMNQLSQQAVNSIISNTQDLVEYSVDAFKSKVMTCLKENGIQMEDVEGLGDILHQQTDFSKACDTLKTEYLQIKYFVENFQFVAPRVIVLSQHAEYQLVHGRQKLKVIKETFQYVPVLETLKALLTQPDVITEVRNQHCTNDDSICDFCDGEDFKNHELFGQNPHALILHCYFDEFQVTNPLGSKTKKHKIGAFYFELGNIQPCYRSTTSMIYLIALCKVPVLKKFGIDRILKPFMEDVKLLESDHGVLIKIEGQDQVFRGSIGPFSSDNLGAHMLGGYQESFNALRCCRVCMATKHEISSKFHGTDFQLRTRNSYHQHSALVSDDASLASVYGVKRNSILNQSCFFHVVDGLDLDVMHDQLEGVLPLTLKLLIINFIHVDKLFTLDLLNQRIATFIYGPADITNKPSPIKQGVIAGNRSGSISQSAAQMWCLSRMFPLLIGDLVPEGDAKWENFLLLLKIEEIVFAPKTSVQLAAYLDILIGDYLEEFTKLYEMTLIPKQHFMVHYPKQIVRRGPLVRHWAMRFEAKHNYFKRLVGTINNFRHIEFSLAMRHQALQAFLVQSSSGNFFRMSVEHGPVEQLG